ncbi:SsgA family sporulation/cell division regulator [Streptomyces tendae]|uniref:SsgA family sporulation/cell division regulator n=1 Tax=Streptomyces tendae TaxID=1932 RepID=UPI0037A8695B
MHVTLELATGAVLLTPDGDIPVPVTLRYCSSDPLAVRLVFPPSLTAEGREAAWAFARSLLAEGLATGSGLGSVRIRPAGPSHTLVRLCCAQASATLRFDTRTLRRFLARTHVVVAPADETAALCVEDDLAALFGGRF